MTLNVLCRSLLMNSQQKSWMVFFSPYGASLSTTALASNSQLLNTCTSCASQHSGNFAATASCIDSKMGTAVAPQINTRGILCVADGTNYAVMPTNVFAQALDVTSSSNAAVVNFAVLPAASSS